MYAMKKPILQKDVIIIGAGMAGLTAALYASRLQLSVLVLENGIVGGQIANATNIENYPGFLQVSGKELIETLTQQAEHFGAILDEFDTIERVSLKKTPKIIETADHIYKASAVIIASGMNRRRLPLPEERRYASRGVHYCELCDGQRYQDKTVAVIGGGNAAVDAANFLTKYARKLYLIHRSTFRADEVSVQRLRDNPKAEILLGTEVQALHGESWLSSIDVCDKASGETRSLAVDGIFVNIGVVPNTELFAQELPLAEGRIRAGEDCRTDIPGIFAAGDVREKEIRQLTTAAADGTTAALLAGKYIEQIKRANSR